jgi:HSP20 family protein
MALNNLLPWVRPRPLSTQLFGERDPFHSLHRDMTGLLEEFARGFGTPTPNSWSSSWPHVELSETENDVKIVAELPGVEEKDIDVALYDGVLTIKGEKDSRTESALYTERWHGQFQRSFQVGANIDPDKVTAAFKNGILSVTLAKRADAQPPAKRIPVAAS